MNDGGAIIERSCCGFSLGGAARHSGSLGVATLGFRLIHLVPGDPVQAMLGETASPAGVADLRGRLGLDRPLLTFSTPRF